MATTHDEPVFYYRKSKRQVGYNLLTMAIAAPLIIHLTLRYVVVDGIDDIYNTTMPAFILVSLILIDMARHSLIAPIRERPLAR